ncbi:histone-lysine N-methyltransferase ATXR4 isoform X2 [Sesamum indicum]|uniref:Histone-lysine N-methyltransferase ATXR4 isoform X2 n=1 Tax=Sesamum indicum TaxID=4182 RepID=A0A8M8V0H8_SESIN|nr:histone-lysine N-methyltransferase ATXR4 isoform X2 [Sesamum indicum]
MGFGILILKLVLEPILGYSMGPWATTYKLSVLSSSDFHTSQRMSRLARYSFWALQLRKLHSSHIATLSFPSSFSTSASQSTATRPSPPPIHVGLTEYAGRGVFASRRISAGELIHTAQPIVSHPSLSSVHTVCYFCLRKLPSSARSLEASQTVSFCSTQCEDQSKFYDVEKKADWSRFNEYCRLQGLKYPLLVKRLACQVISGVVSSDVLDILQPEIPSSDRISKMKKEVALLNNTFEGSDIGSEQMAFLTEEWYAGVLARIRINAFRIELAIGSYEDLLSLAAASVEAEAAVGNAVYVLPSLYNHDCDPNVNIVWIENVDAKVKALRDIEEGEELRICYIDASMDYKARQTILYEGFGFHCNCLRCASKD